MSSRDPTDGDDGDEDTLRWTTDPTLLATERRRAESERSQVRMRPEEQPLLTLVTWTDDPALDAAIEEVIEPPPPPSAPPTAYVHVNRVRALYERFVRVVGPAAKPVFEGELRAMGVTPSRITEPALSALIERLAARIPIPASRERFMEEDE
ncbi:Hypothetical protein I5071_48960 [Sandaracinus amylolyticus]|nr:Hypothetical protein I5071_48960 [Sandaracinus amylolyticus]